MHITVHRRDSLWLQTCIQDGSWETDLSMRYDHAITYAKRFSALLQPHSLPAFRETDYSMGMPTHRNGLSTSQRPDSKGRKREVGKSRISSAQSKMRWIPSTSIRLSLPEKERGQLNKSATYYFALNYCRRTSTYENSAEFELLRDQAIEFGKNS